MIGIKYIDDYDVTLIKKISVNKVPIQAMNIIMNVPTHPIPQKLSLPIITKRTKITSLSPPNSLTTQPLISPLISTLKAPSISLAPIKISINEPLKLIILDENYEFKLIDKLNKEKSQEEENKRKIYYENLLNNDIILQNLGIPTISSSSTSTTTTTSSTITLPTTVIKKQHYMLPTTTEKNNKKIYLEKIKKLNDPYLSNLNENIFEWILYNSEKIPQLSSSLTDKDVIQTILPIYKRDHIIIFNKGSNGNIERIDTIINKN